VLDIDTGVTGEQMQVVLCRWLIAWLDGCSHTSSLHELEDTHADAVTIAPAGLHQLPPPSYYVKQYTAADQWPCTPEDLLRQQSARHGP
jgi:hypothetical protein